MIIKLLNTTYELPFTQITHIYPHIGREYGDLMSRWFLFIYAETIEKTKIPYTLQKIPIRHSSISEEPINLEYLKIILVKNPTIKFDERIDIYLKTGKIQEYTHNEFIKDEELRTKIFVALNIGLYLGVVLGIIVLVSQLLSS